MVVHGRGALRAPIALLVATGALAGLVHCAAPTSEADATALPVPTASNEETEAGSPPVAPPALEDAGAALADAAAAPTPPPPPSLTSPFVVGFNEAWFGPSYSSDLTTGFDLGKVTSTFDGIAAARGRVVRVWLFEGMEGIPLGTGSPRIGDVSPALLANLRLVLEAARARGLAVYLTGLDGNAMPDQAGPLRDLAWNLMNGLYGELEAYETKVLAPLLATLASYQDVVWAFDLMNELEAPRHKGYFSDPAFGPRTWMQREVAFVKARAPWLKVTTSAGHDTAAYDLALGVFSGVGLDFYDLHVYADDGVVPNLANVCKKAADDGVPIILGEFGQKTMVDDDTLQANATKAFLTAAKGSCFKAALPWRWDAAEVTWRFVRADGTLRPAADVVKTFLP